MDAVSSERCLGVLSANVCNAVAPALAAKEGGGRREEMLQLVRRGSLLGGTLVLLFAVPLVLLINPILNLWSGMLPSGCAQRCVAMLLVAVSLWKLDYGIVSIGWEHVFSEVLQSLICVYFARRLEESDIIPS